jgi:hypothetical protein
MYDKESIIVTYYEELHQMIENEVRTLHSVQAMTWSAILK